VGVSILKLLEVKYPLEDSYFLRDFFNLSSILSIPLSILDLREVNSSESPFILRVPSDSSMLALNLSADPVITPNTPVLVAGINTLPPLSTH